MALQDLAGFEVWLPVCRMLLLLFCKLHKLPSVVGRYSKFSTKTRAKRQLQCWAGA
jgi:hypothetical protein